MGGHSLWGGETSYLDEFLGRFVITLGEVRRAEETGER